MGYIPNTNKTLTAYLTQKGREYVVSGDKDGFTVKYFSLGDPDVDYYFASQENQDGKPNMLPAGNIPDLSGDDDGAIHSLAGGIKQRFTIFGGTAIKHLGTNLTLGSPRGVARFVNTSLNVYLNRTSTDPTQYTFNVPIELLGGVATGYETVKAYVLPPSQGTDVAVYPILTVGVNSGGIFNWGAGSSSTQNVSCLLNDASNTQVYTAKLRLVAYKSALSIDPEKSVITLNIIMQQKEADTTSPPITKEILS